MNAKEFFDLFGGQSAVSVILNLNSPRMVQKWVFDNCIPQWAIDDLKVHMTFMKKIIDEPSGFIIKKRKRKRKRKL